MNGIIGLLIGLVLGSINGVIILSLLFAAKNGDLMMGEITKEEPDGEDD